MTYPQFVNVNLSDEVNEAGKYPKVVPVRVVGSDIPLGGGGVDVSATEPENPSEGDLWLNSTTGEMQVYFGEVWQVCCEVSPLPDAPTIYSIEGTTTSPVTGGDPTPTVVVNDVESGDEVNLYANDEVIGTGTADSTSISIDTSSLDAGTYSITAKITRAGIKSHASEPFIYTYNAETVNPPIILSVNAETSSPATGDVSTPDVIVGDVEIGDLVTIYDGETSVGSGTVSGETITITTSELTESEHSLTATITRDEIESDASNTFVYTYTVPATVAVFSDFVKVSTGGDATEEDGVITFPDGVFSAWTNVNYSDNAYCEFTVVTYPTSEFCMSFRDDSGDRAYGYNCDDICAYNPSVTNVYIGSVSNGGQSWDANTPWTVTAGDVIRVEISGDTITVKQNGTTLLTDTANFETGSYWGITTQSSGVISDFKFGQL
jgi:hypothetical protein